MTALIPDKKWVILAGLIFFLANQNAGYTWHQCSHLQAEGALLLYILPWRLPVVVKNYLNCLAFLLLTTSVLNLRTKNSYQKCEQTSLQRILLLCIFFHRNSSIKEQEWLEPRPAPFILRVEPSSKTTDPSLPMFSQHVDLKSQVPIVT